MLIQMASIKEILSAEERTDHTVTLYPDGSLFYKAYERSAYLFVHGIKQYEASRKFYKYCNAEVVLVAFPQKTLPLLDCQYVVNADNTVTIAVDMEVDDQQYQQWKSQAPLYQKASHPLPLPFTPSPALLPTDLHPEEQDVIRRLRQFNLADSTPMEAMLFLSELKKQLTIKK